MPSGHFTSKPLKRRVHGGKIKKTAISGIQERIAALIRSMTGYGRGTAAGSQWTVTVEMRSVNHRYADFILRLPRDLLSLEEKVRRLLQQDIRRGRLEVSVNLEASSPRPREVSVDGALARAYHQALVELARSLSLETTVDAAYLGSLPDVLSVQAPAVDGEAVWPPLHASLLAALEDLLRRRCQEGENLALDLAQRCGILADMAGRMTERGPVVQEEYRRRLERKMKEYLGAPPEEARLLMECALLAERIGIDEELVRLCSHLEAFREALHEDGPVGRKLDFIAQEMFREVNTIGSKSADYGLAGLVVEAKAELEKIREQVQNVE